jgi:hypothetical protein
MVISDHNQPASCNGIVYLGYRTKAFDVHTTEIKKILIRILHELYVLLIE